jgi:hypothetical protein
MKKIEQKLRKKIKIVLAITLVSFVACIVFMNYNNKLPFNSSDWLYWVENEKVPSDRYLMAIDLIEKSTLNGMSKLYVRKFLGYPSDSFNLSYMYDLGKSKFGAEYYLLIIKFDMNHKVINCEIISH